LNVSFLAKNKEQNNICQRDLLSSIFDNSWNVK